MISKGNNEKVNDISIHFNTVAFILNTERMYIKSKSAFRALQN